MEAFAPVVGWLLYWVVLWPPIFGPMHLWGWVWQLPLRLARRVSFILIPWGFIGVLHGVDVGVGYLARTEKGPGRELLVKMLKAERAVSAAARQPVEWWLTSSVVGDKGFAPLRVVERAGRSLSLGFFLSFLFGGPLWVPLGLVLRGKRRSAPGFWSVSGRPMRPVSTRNFQKLRVKAILAKQWFVGRGQTSRRPINLGTESRLMHTWVVGATGTGKTQSVLLPALFSDVCAKRPVVFIDGKGDKSTLDALWTMALVAKRQGDFKYFDLRNPGASLSFSPLLHGSPNEQLDKIMAALRWDNEFYRATSMSSLLRVLRALRAAGRPYTLDDVLAALSSLDALRELAALVKDAGVKDELEELARRWKEVQVETSGLRAQLESMLMTDFGQLLKSPVPALDLAEAYRNNSIVYFALPVARFPETAPLVAKLILADLNSVAGMVQDGQLERKFCSVVIDEFAAFAMPLFIDLLNKARSAGMAITISHQSMRGDLAAAKPGFLEQVAACTNVKVVLAQNESQDAEYAAGLAGTYKTAKYTDQTETVLIAGERRTGVGSVREVDEYRISPNLIRGLAQGEAVVQVKQPFEAAVLDVVVLDRFPMEQLPSYEAKAQASSMGSVGGLELRRREREAKAAALSARAAVRPQVASSIAAKVRAASSSVASVPLRREVQVPPVDRAGRGGKTEAPATSPERSLSEIRKVFE
jgi:TraM recognition site of TraD and TraG